jgi:hypothetical protein
MAVHANAVADAVGEVFVVGAVAGGCDEIACGGVDGLALDPGACRGEGGGLGFENDVEDFAGFVEFGDCRVTEDEGARDVGLIAFDGAAVVDEDDLAFADDLRL